MALKALLSNLSEGVQGYPNHNTPSTAGGFNYGGGSIFNSLTFNQRTLEFGKGTAYDRPNQEFSREPLIGKNIDLPGPNAQASSFLGFIDSLSDGLVRGGLPTALSRSAKDVARITKFYLTSRGIGFLTKQIGLQKSNPNIEAGSTSFDIFGLSFNLNRNTTFNLGLNLIAQAGVNFSGVHFDRSGATPIFPEDQKYEKTVLNNADSVGSLSNNSGIEGGNRLLTLHGTTGVGIGAVENREDPTGPSGFNLFGINIGGSFGENISNVITNIQNFIGIGPDQVGKLYEYNGGPNSLYGIGKTTIRRYTETIGDHLKVDYEGLGYYIPNNKYSSLIYPDNSRIRAYQSTPIPILGERGSGNAGYTIQPNNSELAINQQLGDAIASGEGEGAPGRFFSLLPFENDRTLGDGYLATDDNGNPLYINQSKDGIGNLLNIDGQLNRERIRTVLYSASLQTLYSSYTTDRSETPINIGNVDNRLEGIFSFRYTDAEGTSTETETPNLFIPTPIDGEGNVLLHITSESLANVRRSASLQESLSPYSLRTSDDDEGFGVNPKLIDRFTTGDNAVSDLFIRNNFSVYSDPANLLPITATQAYSLDGSSFEIEFVRSAADLDPLEGQYVGLSNPPINDIGEVGSQSNISGSSPYAEDSYKLQRFPAQLVGLANELGILTYDSLMTIGINKPDSRNVLDFRQLKNAQGARTTPFTDYSRTTVNNPGASFIREERVNLGNPGQLDIKRGFAYNVYDERTVDGLNALDVIRIDDGDFTSQAFRDLIRFRIEAVDTDNPEESDVMFFRALLDSYNDNFNGSWNEFTYNGRGESLYNYGGFNRDIGFDFKIAAQSRHEMMPLYRKLNFLCSQTAPDYSGGTRMRGPFVKITIGSLLDRTPGFIKSVGLSWDKDYPWEINITGPEEGNDREMQVLPHVLNVSVKFQPVHNFLPQKSITDSPFLFKHERNGSTREEEKWYKVGAAQSVNEALPVGTRNRGLGQQLTDISNAQKLET